MKSITYQLLSVLILFLISVSCKNDVKSKSQLKEVNSKSTIKYAKGFEIQSFTNYKKLIIKAPYQNSKETFEFILTKTKSKNNFKEIATPINSIVVTSTTHIPMLELLQVENKLVGYPNSDYISSIKTRKLIEDGKIIDLGNEENINTESLINLKPDVVVGFSINSNNKMFTTIENLGIPVILNGDWLEETPLGRAEWIRFFGVLFDKEKEADSIFNTIEKNYIEAKNTAIKSKNTPTIISGGLFKDIWNLPAGDSFEATFLKDANTNYLWKDSKGKGSLSLNIENVFEKGKDANLWISPSFYTSLEEIKKANDIYSNFEAFKNKEVYSFVNKRGEKGGIIYFELAPARPDLVLKDLIKIAHPELMEDYKFTFFEKLK
ncbi:ABC transporter substrate-binding protein [Lutibacter flavus]|uniref:Iron complex transport system substrate-binding protein n=1 Tax=Lutibacter flavus TaxID=691689 RepID=A0A238VIZ8_9FLAO|nr:ABC transporter substrate-binding protein [Lutibacter flavus]SNR34196.1 iron complex transport system substrate-binding protein [Lutibacter flavus]